MRARKGNLVCGSAQLEAAGGWLISQLACPLPPPKNYVCCWFHQMPRALGAFAAFLLVLSARALVSLHWAWHTSPAQPRAAPLRSMPGANSLISNAYATPGG
jgi:hypothetical protein